MRWLPVFAVLLAACSSTGTENSSTDFGDEGHDAAVSTDVAGLDLSDAPDVGASVEVGPDVRLSLRDDELLFALRRDAVATMNALGYNRARDAMYARGGIDDHGGRIEGLYTGRTVDTDGTRTPSANCRFADGSPTTCVFNTEHTFARVHLRDALIDGTPEYDAAEGDLHHLFPSEETANNARANFDFGVSDCLGMNNCAFDERSQLGLPVGGAGPTSCPMTVDPGEDLCVMDVRMERRGDVARAQFYMSMRYELPLAAPLENQLRAWSMADPPDDLERGRNDAIEAVQGNRNPFIDDPGLLDRISDF